MKIFMTGDRGYIGKRLKIYLKECFGDSLQIEGYDIKNGEDITNPVKLFFRIKKFSPDIVIHLAAVSNVTDCEKDRKRAFEVNVVGTKNILEGMSKIGCKNIIYASTCAVYRHNAKLPFTEKSDCSPISNYGVTKLLGEQVLFTPDFNAIILRMFNVVSPKLEELDLTEGNDRLFSAIKTGNVTIYGDNYQTADGTAERDYISLEEVCKAYFCAVRYFETNKGKKFNKVYNVCSGKKTSVKTIINAYNEVLDKKIITKIGERRSGDPPVVYGNNRAIMEIFWETDYDVVKDIIGQ